eukprot:340800-Amphidinium_carterae.1
MCSAYIPHGPHLNNEVVGFRGGHAQRTQQPSYNLKVSRGGVAAKVDMTSPTAIELFPLVS